ncbi:MAG TPA: helix-turn-helix domain-containing protein [Jatrophihabitantaceae bacterium]|jgi:DNA-binding MarR family transcriptional regulator
MTTTTSTNTGSAATTPDHQAEDRVDAASRHLYEAECALHTAHQSHVDAWIAAAGERLHAAVTEHLAAVAEAHEREGRASAKKLTDKQRALLETLATRTRPSGGVSLAERLGAPPAGIHRTAASLARHGLLYRLHYGGIGVQYEISPAGRAALAGTETAT